MTDSNEEVTVTRNEAQQRYEIHVGDALGGYTDFAPDSEGRVVYANTQIDPAFTGRGLGSTLVAEAMAESGRRKEIVVPRCSFVAHYLENHAVDGLTVHADSA